MLKFLRCKDIKNYLSRFARKIGCASEIANKFAFLSACTIFVARYGNFIAEQSEESPDRAEQCAVESTDGRKLMFGVTENNRPYPQGKE